MDDSEVYTKMADHEKIQNEWEPKVGDRCVHREHHSLGNLVVIAIPGFPKYRRTDRLILRCTPDRDENWIRDKADLIFKPRQDQLIEMLPKRKNFIFLLEDLDTFIFDNLVEDHGKVPYTPPLQKEWENASMEQLWLAFMMYELHNLRWDGGWRKG